METKPEDQESYYFDCGHCVDKKEKEKKKKEDVKVPHAQWLAGLTEPWTDTEDNKEERERENPFEAYTPSQMKCTLKMGELKYGSTEWDKYVEEYKPQDPGKQESKKAGQKKRQKLRNGGLERD